MASDHAGFEYKGVLKSHLESQGVKCGDLGTHSAGTPVDYPDFIRPAAQAVADGQFPHGIVLGGSGNGEAIVANKIKGIRCALCWNEATGRLAKEHGNCNMISIGQRMVSQDEAIAIVEAWLSAKFKGGRHQDRINKIEE